MKKVFGILLVGLLSMSLEAHSKDVSRKVKKPVSLKQSVSAGNVNQNSNYQNEEFPEQKMIGMANPSSVYCVEQSGESITKQNKDGSEYGICKFKDGKEVDEWEFYRQNHDLTEKGVPENNKK